MKTEHARPASELRVAAMWRFGHVAMCVYVDISGARVNSGPENCRASKRRPQDRRPQDLPPEGGQDTGSTGHGTLMAAAVKP